MTTKKQKKIPEHIQNELKQLSILDTRNSAFQKALHKYRQSVLHEEMAYILGKGISQCGNYNQREYDILILEFEKLSKHFHKQFDLVDANKALRKVWDAFPDEF